MANNQSPLGPWYDRWKRGGWALGTLGVALSLSISAINAFRFGPDFVGWLFVLAAVIAAGCAVFNFVRWLELRKAEKPATP